MGSMSRFTAIERVARAFENEIFDYFSDLIGMTVENLVEESIEVECHVGAFVPLTGLSDWEGVYVHFRWASEEEVNLGEEIGGSSVPEFNEVFAGNKIVSISLDDFDRDDEVYLFAKIGEHRSLEIPLGFNSERCEFSGILKEILTEEQRSSFIEKYVS